MPEFENTIRIVPTIKPLDREAILRAASTDRLLVTLENHTVVGGLAESVASCLAFASQGRRVVPIALPDGFLDTGALPTSTTATGSPRTGWWRRSWRSSATAPSSPRSPATRGRKSPPGPASPSPRAPDTRPNSPIGYPAGPAG